MTRNQLEFWNIKERSRIAEAELEEKKRSNIVNEQELLRSHQANEANATKLAEIQALNVAETGRSNRAKEFETNRANLMREDLEQQLRNIQQFTATIESSKAQTLAKQAAIAAGQLAETVRSNQANELLRQGQLDEQVRYNTESLSEAHRANLAKESNQSLATLYTRLNKLTDYEIAEMNLTQTQVRDLNNLKLGLYNVLLRDAEAGIANNKNTIEAVKVLSGTAQTYGDLLK